MSKNVNLITGFEDIDKLINISTVKNDKLVIIGGASTIDRTNLALNIVKNVLEQNKAVLYFSLGAPMQSIKNNSIISNIDDLSIYSYDENGRAEKHK